MTKLMATQIESPGRRDVQFWFDDGLPEIVFGLLMFPCVGVAIAASMIPAISGWLAFLPGWILFCIWLWNYRSLMEFLKSHVTYPRAGYVQTPEDPYSDQSLFQTLFPGIKPDSPITLRNAPAPNKNMSDFRARAIALLGLAILIGIVSGILIGVYSWSKWSLGILMTAMAALVFLMSRNDAHSYSLYSVLPIALAGSAIAFLNLSHKAIIVAPAFILGAWFLIRGTWMLVCFLESHPRLNETHRGSL
jgi:hypothetical protein